MGEPAGDTPPWFFLSYAHRRGAAPADVWVSRFHADLTSALGAGGPGPHGFLDLPGEGETRRGELRSAALGRCRTFVPLYSPDYFTDLECHREWTAFHRRPAASGDPHAAVVPVLWERLWGDRPGRVAVDRRGLAERFGQDGLRAAAAKPRLREEYLRAVRGVAEAVRAAVARADLAPGDPGPLDGPPEPWPDHPIERTLRIRVLARRRGDRLPPGCDDGRYGARARDWQPYGFEPALSVAEFAARQAHASNIHVTAIEDFEEVAADDPGPGTVEGPQLLLLDRWALCDTRLRALLLTHNERRRRPLAVMVPWDPRTPGAAAHERTLQELTLATLDRAVGRPKPDFEPLRRGIPDAAAFADLLPRATEQARQAFFALRSIDRTR
ncbi:FxsC protein [Streptacidiphilus cavernicola]|uniref:FxsC protein n=1 Tax=Streptacidiphilus cavernicola TaxID=3342716 RepID=A0ABV6VNN2_9ACTN